MKAGGRVSHFIGLQAFYCSTGGPGVVSEAAGKVHYSFNSTFWVSTWTAPNKHEKTTYWVNAVSAQWGKFRWLVNGANKTVVQVVRVNNPGIMCTTQLSQEFQKKSMWLST